MWVKFFRLCIETEQKVVVTPPILFGRGYVFDRPRRIVKVSRCIMGIPMSRIRIPFGSFRLRVRENERTVYKGGGSAYGGPYAPESKSVKRVYTVAMRIPGQLQELDVAHFDFDKLRAERLLSAIRRVTAFRRDDSN